MARARRRAVGSVASARRSRPIPPPARPKTRRLALPAGLGRSLRGSRALLRPLRGAAERLRGGRWGSRRRVRPVPPLGGALRGALRCSRRRSSRVPEARRAGRKSVFFLQWV